MWLWISPEPLDALTFSTFMAMPLDAPFGLGAPALLWPPLPGDPGSSPSLSAEHPQEPGQGCYPTTAHAETEAHRDLAQTTQEAMAETGPEPVLRPRLVL